MKINTPMGHKWDEEPYQWSFGADGDVVLSLRGITVSLTPKEVESITRIGEARRPYAVRQK